MKTKAKPKVGEVHIENTLSSFVLPKGGDSENLQKKEKLSKCKFDENL